MIAIVERTAAELSGLLPHPEADANKYSRGKLAFVGGSAAYPGAACLACTAAGLMGAGYVEARCSDEAARALHVRRPSVVARSWGGWDPSAALKASAHPAACLVGPGMDAADPDQAELARAVARACELPLVIDGGALTAVASAEGRAICLDRSMRDRVTVLTPHGGEAARLARAADVAVPPADADELALARYALELAHAYGATVLLKGPCSYIASPPAPADGARGVIAMRHGTPALAKAGTGDVLAGMVGALLAQGLAAADACVLGSTLHAEAGRAAQSRLGDIAVCAEDVLDAIPEAIRFL